MEQILKNKKDPKNKNEDTLLRPQTLQEYAGQEDIKHILNIYIQASRKRKETLDHLLFYGPPGLGKTTLARIIANELKTNIKITNGAILEKAGDLSAILSSLQTGEILFIDEIHRLPKTVEEILYSAMEDYALDIVIGKDYDRRTIRIKLSAFSLIGATTKFGHISFPLRDRFGLTLKLDYYKESELKTILQRTAKVYNNYIEEEALTELVKRSRGTPRIANRLFRRTRDFAEIYSNKVITHQITLETLKKLKIDENGLNETDYNYLNNLVFKFNGGPVGIKNLAATLGEEIFTIEEVYEPYLIQKGYIKRTPKGRIATNLTIKLLNKLNRKSI
ncbi:MAG: Holliday junction branch migration DNA helicase RuvB [Sweet potato little leaf phytoplasma]|uniref:Holliday junction branch migration DNA helicase RuvB n=1 Tax=Candidatus Phytoplasma australasiaticum TaxID=2754999 RepID=UPI00210EFC8E|nr:Holliday junction branch migration DNA helicase RuvB [Sweet potato little leaf phytoplasma]MDO7986972.1 Holliday junction branch migration DNA helicase RuvB [Sweet potato little leaf phytoplasma]MDO8005354.1 Holliday junction branch migration DNA helicase RuvB [Sweet potato little leaf phytoplasma]MDO8008569.1 Holliday junction branch migration DNA helicase RuvB [Sweet potato little leaf phytoplasma]MDO8020303.1 Holliday junction branch migration DNA helicase RuvB [Sweet potato little leaf p